MYDVMDNLPEKTIKCLDHGHVTLIDVMPRLVPEDTKTADYAIVQAARVSYGNGTKTVNEDRGLIRFLCRHSHSTPQEMVEFKLHVKLPIFCARQMIRHRMASVNEISGRYSVMKDEFYFPEAANLKKQSQNNKQGGDDTLNPEEAGFFLDELKGLCENSYDHYETWIGDGISREQARIGLPLNLYTEWYWKVDLHNLLHFLALRCDKHAQWEMRVFADAILALVKPLVPAAIEAWEDYHPMRGAMKLTRLEVDAIKKAVESLDENIKNQFRELVSKIDTDNKREAAEWLDKMKIFGLGA